MGVKPDFDFKIERLSKNINICVTKEHTFSTDSFLLASFSSPKKNDVVCDFGTGCGIIPFYWSEYYSPKRIYGVDIMDRAIRQFKYSLTLSKINPPIVPLHLDLKEITKEIKKSSCNLVTMNPPFKTLGTGLLSESPSEKVARHETKATLREIVKAGSDILSFGGRLVLCQRPQRLFELSSLMKDHKIEPKRLRFVKSFADKKPWLFLLEGVKGAKPFLNVEPDLVTRDNGGFTEEMMEIYKEYHN